MGNLYEIVDLHVLLDACLAHHCTVDGRVGTYLNVIFDYYGAYLRDLAVHALCVRLKAETISANHAAGVNDTVAADGAVVVDLHAGVDNRVVAYRGVVAYVCLRIDLHALAELDTLAYVGECANVRVVGQGSAFGYERRLLHAVLARAQELRDALQQRTYSLAGIIHQDQCRRTTERGVVQ